MAIGATGSEDAWQRVAYISVENSSTVKLQYEALTETIDIDNGERELDVINLVNQGQIPKHGAMGITTITFEGYPLQAGTADTAGATRGTPSGGLATGYFDAFASVQNTDSASQLDIDISNTLTRYRVAILWTDQDVLSDTAASSSDSGSGSITVDGTPFTADTYNGARLKVTSGTASGGQYMITDTANNAFTLTAGDTPATDGVADNDSLEVYPTGASALLQGSKGNRKVLADCICTSCKTTFTDGIMKQTLVFKGRNFNLAGVARYKEESCTASDTLTALGNYTAGTTPWA
jgi:hypothetical protein